LTGSSEWADPVAVTVGAGAVNGIEAGRADGPHEQLHICGGIHVLQTIGRTET
jgi:hypothetical protein